MSGGQDGQANSKDIPESTIDDLMRRFRGFEVPDGLFDPSGAPAELLQSYGLPPKPDPNGQPLLRRAWEKGFGKPMRMQQFEFDRSLMASTHDGSGPRSFDAIPFAGSRFESSDNWSGAYVTANHDRRFLQAWGTWTVPDNLKLPPQSLQGPPTIPYTCSNWIGLDGQRRYLNSSLPQIGTASTRQPDGTTTAQAWTQWWARGNTEKNAPVPLALAVQPGNEVLCVLTALDPRTVVFVMVNLTGQEVPTAISVLGTSPEVRLPDGTLVRPDIAGATAEWIMERPSVVGQPTAYNFPDYGEAKFELCIAVEGDDVNISSWSGGSSQHLRGARLLRIFDVLADPARTAFTSMPKKLDDTSIHLKYGGFHTTFAD